MNLPCVLQDAIITSQYHVSSQTTERIVHCCLFFLPSKSLLVVEGTTGGTLRQGDEKCRKINSLILSSGRDASTEEVIKICSFIHKKVVPI